MLFLVLTHHCIFQNWIMQFFFYIKQYGLLAHLCLHTPAHNLQTSQGFMVHWSALLLSYLTLWDTLWDTCVTSVWVVHLESSSPLPFFFWVYRQCSFTVESVPQGLLNFVVLIWQHSSTASRSHRAFWTWLISSSWENRERFICLSSLHL